jgi:hypothetical protein
MQGESYEEERGSCLATLERRVGKKLKRGRDSLRGELYDKDLMSVESASTWVITQRRSALNARPLSIERRVGALLGEVGRIRRSSLARERQS